MAASAPGPPEPSGGQDPAGGCGDGCYDEAEDVYRLITHVRSGLAVFQYHTWLRRLRDLWCLVLFQLRQLAVFCFF